MILKCADITGYEHEEFIVKLPGILEHKQILTWSIVFNNCRTKMINYTYIKRDRSCIRVQASYNTDIKLHGIILVYNQDQTGYSLTKYIKLTLCMEGRS